ncbi:MAG: Hpt domain-containing protein [Alteromonadaceae bacterium]|nr:Hpt domain-containing protein [Alteromonadaceae bacterium]
MTEQPRLDENALAELKEVMDSDFDALVQTFLADSRSRIQTLREALGQADEEQIVKTAHSFKGSCINMGAPRLSDHCSQAEQAGKAGDLSGMDVRLARIEQEFEEVERRLSQL